MMHAAIRGLVIVAILAVGACGPSPEPAKQPANPAPPAAPASSPDAKPAEPEPVEPATPNAVAGPTIPLALTASLEHDGVRVKIDNPTDQTVRVWTLGNSWGDGSWALRLRVEGEGGRTFMLRPTNQAYTRNLPRFIEVPAKGEQELRMKPSGREWTAGEDLSALESATVFVQAVLEIGTSPEAVEHGVAVGHVESAEVLSKPPHSWLFGD